MRVWYNSLYFSTGLTTCNQSSTLFLVYQILDLLPQFQLTSSPFFNSSLMLFCLCLEGRLDGFDWWWLVINDDVTCFDRSNHSESQRLLVACSAYARLSCLRLYRCAYFLAFDCLFLGKRIWLESSSALSVHFAFVFCLLWCTSYLVLFVLFASCQPEQPSQLRASYLYFTCFPISSVNEGPLAVQSSSIGSGALLFPCVFVCLLHCAASWSCQSSQPH